MGRLNSIVLTALKAIAIEGPKEPDSGICRAVFNYVDDNVDYGTACDAAGKVGKTLMSWPGTTGKEWWPIEGVPFSEESLPVWENPRRIEALHWLIGHFENLLGVGDDNTAQT